MNNMKECKSCWEWKDTSQFHHSPSAKDHLASYCKPCTVKRSMESKIKNGEMWYHRDGYATEWQHFNAALETYARIFDMPRLTRYKVSGSIKSSDLKYKP